MDLETLEPPFDQICADAIANDEILYNNLCQHMHEKWKTYSLRIQFAHEDNLNAIATKDRGAYQIRINRGAVEHIFGTFYGFMSYPEYLPLIGEAAHEVVQDGLLQNGLRPIPIKRNQHHLWEYCPCPRTPLRQHLALQLATIALEFLVFHEIGHVVAGHLELKSGGQESVSMAEIDAEFGNESWNTLAQVCECDADLFATHITNWISTHESTASLTKSFFEIADLTEMEAAQLVHLSSVGTLFRILFPTTPLKIEEANGSHPHPAVRVGVTSAFSLAIAMDAGKIQTQSLNRLFMESLIGMENVWADLQLSGQIVDSREIWARSLNSGITELLENCSRNAILLDQYAHLERQWNCW